MDLFGLGGNEILLLLLLGGVVLGPRRLAQLAREIRRISTQMRGLARNLTEELDRELAQIEAKENQLAAKPTTTETAPATSTAAVEELPEAYRNFRQDFPDEALPEPAVEVAPPPPATTASSTVVPPQPSPAPAASAPPVRATPPARPPMRVGHTRPSVIRKES